MGEKLSSMMSVIAIVCMLIILDIPTLDILYNYIIHCGMQINK